MWTKITQSRWIKSLGWLTLLILGVLLLLSFLPEKDSGMETLPETNPPEDGISQATITKGGGTETEALATMVITAISMTIPDNDSICAEAWGITPGQPIPEWLLTPANVEGLHTQVKYSILAGQLITHGIVDASSCIDSGLTRDGTANTCGMETAYPQVITWQNQFDEAILKAANDNRIPAQVLKRLFAQESQFWPPNTLAPATYGIGNVTSPGIEPLFTWYDDIYLETCRGLSTTDCSQPYHNLTLQEQQVLRGFFISQHMHVYCPTCPYTIDMDKTASSIDYFAKLLVANCHQTGLVLSNHGFATSGIAYEDAWRLTLANYTKGVGCVINAINSMEIAEGFSWEGFTERLTPECAVDIYINRITGE